MRFLTHMSKIWVGSFLPVEALGAINRAAVAYHAKKLKPGQIVKWREVFKCYPPGILYKFPYRFPYSHFVRADEHKLFKAKMQDENTFMKRANYRFDDELINVVTTTDQNGIPVRVYLSGTTVKHVDTGYTIPDRHSDATIDGK